MNDSLSVKGASAISGFRTLARRLGSLVRTACLVLSGTTSLVLLVVGSWSDQYPVRLALQMVGSRSPPLDILGLYILRPELGITVAIPTTKMAPIEHRRRSLIDNQSQDRWVTMFTDVVEFERYESIQTTNREKLDRKLQLRVIGVHTRRAWWLLPAIIGTWPTIVCAVAALRVARKAWRARLNRCLHCGYLLKGLINPRCPECGEAFLF